jgi:plasmid stabilization system protein ParE
MSRFRLSPEAEAQLDDIWLRIARESGNIDTATRIAENITDRQDIEAYFHHRNY